jgi:hypothetical protein
MVETTQWRGNFSICKTEKGFYSHLVMRFLARKIFDLVGNSVAGLLSRPGTKGLLGKNSGKL